MPESWTKDIARSSIFIIIFTFHFLPTYLYSSHIVGGDVTYKFLSYNTAQTEVTYNVSLNLYRDPNGIDFSPEIDFGVFIQDDAGTWSSYKVVENVFISVPYTITPETDPCKTSFLTDNQLIGARYTFDVTLEISDHNYMIAYQACCRNYGLNNIISNGDVGAVYDIVITPEAQRLGNNSPQFNTIPSQFVCVNDNLDINNSASDIDGDSLVYTFCKPKSSGINDNTSADCCGCLTPNPAICTPPYEELTYINGFTASEPMAGMPIIRVNDNTGYIQGTATSQGAYVVAVCVEEYRDGVLLSTIRRDFQYIVILCQDNLQAQVQADSYSIDPISQESISCYESCGILDIEVTNLSTDVNYIDNYTWNIYDADNILIFSSVATNERDVIIPFPESGMYTGHMVISDGSTCTDTAHMKFHISDNIDLSYSIEYDSCVAGPVVITNNSTPADIEYSWELGDGNFSPDYSVIHTYDERDFYSISLSAVDEIGCTDTLTQLLDWTPYELFPPDTIQIDTLLCYHDIIYIFDQWISTDGVYIDYLPALITGCDSIVNEYQVSFTEIIPVTSIYDTICEYSSKLFIGQLVTQAGIYLDTLQSTEDCDSIIQLQLGVTETLYYEYEDEYCEGENYNFNNATINAPGRYTDTLTSSLLCDSIIILNLDLVELSSTYIDTVICDNEFLIFQQDTLMEEGTYTYKLQDGSSCDSTVIVEIEMDPVSYTSIVDTICVGDRYTFGKKILTVAGIYTDYLINQYGCDSIITLELVVGNNLTRIDIDGPIEEYYGNTLYLNPEIIGEELVSYQWSETEDILSNALELEYLLENDNWIYFESENELYCVSIDSIFVRSIVDKDVYIPNIFSPDGDGFNDVFYLGGSTTLEASQLSVYDKWGNLIFINEKTEDITSDTGWDGTYQDRPVEIGTYTYKFELYYINGEQEVVTGSLVLIR